MGPAYSGRSLAGELDFQIGMDACSRGVRFWQSGAHRDHGKLCASRRLNHMNVAVAIARIKGLNRYRDQEIAFSVVTNALASGRVADSVSLVQRVRDVIRERGLFKNPLTIRRRGKLRKRQKEEEH